MKVPLEEFPLSVAVPHHCGPCPLAVTTQLAFHNPKRNSEESRTGQKSTRRPASRSTNCSPKSRCRNIRSCKIRLGSTERALLDLKPGRIQSLTKMRTAQDSLPGGGALNHWPKPGFVASLYQLPINQILAPTCTTQPKQGRTSSLTVVEAEARTAEKGCHRRALNRIPDDKSSVLQAALVLRRVPDGQKHRIRRRRQGD